MRSIVCVSTFLLLACDGETSVEPDGAPAPVDAGRRDGPPTCDAAVSCGSAASGFPRPLGLPERAPDGVFDPDIMRDPSDGRLWVSYSAVDGPPGSGLVSTHL